MEIDPSLKAKEFCTEKVITVKPETTIRETIGLMVENEIRRIPVVEGGKMVGIVISRSVVDFICGGPRANIWMDRLKGDLARGLSLPVKTIMSPHVISAPYNSTLWDITTILLKTGVGGVPLLDKRGEIRGIVSERDLTQFIPEKCDIPVEYHMSRHVISIKPGTPLSDACKLMVSMGVRRLPVLEGKTLVGIITSMDILRLINLEKVYKAILDGTWEEISRLSVSSFMTRNVLTIRHDEDLGKAASIMREEHISGLPVKRDDNVVGIITEHDMLEWLFYALYFEIRKKHKKLQKT